MQNLVCIIQYIFFLSNGMYFVKISQTMAKILLGEEDWCLLLLGLRFLCICQAMGVQNLKF